MDPGHAGEGRNEQGDQADADEAEQRGEQSPADLREEVREGEAGQGHHRGHDARQRCRLGDDAGHIHLKLCDQRSEDGAEGDDHHVEADEGQERVRAEVAQADPRDGDAQADQHEHPQVRMPGGGHVGDEGGGREAERQNAPENQVEHAARHGVDATAFKDSGIDHYFTPQIGTRHERRPYYIMGQ